MYDEYTPSIKRKMAYLNDWTLKNTTHYKFYDAILRNNEEEAIALYRNFPNMPYQFDMLDAEKIDVHDIGETHPCYRPFLCLVVMFEMDTLFDIMIEVLVNEYNSNKSLCINGSIDRILGECISIIFLKRNQRIFKKLVDIGKNHDKTRHLLSALGKLSCLNFTYGEKCDLDICIRVPFDEFGMYHVQMLNTIFLKIRLEAKEIYRKNSNNPNICTYKTMFFDVLINKFTFQLLQCRNADYSSNLNCFILLLFIANFPELLDPAYNKKIIYYKSVIPYFTPIRDFSVILMANRFNSTHSDRVFHLYGRYLRPIMNKIREQPSK